MAKKKGGRASAPRSKPTSKPASAKPAGDLLSRIAGELRKSGQTKAKPAPERDALAAAAAELRAAQAQVKAQREAASQASKRTRQAFESSPREAAKAARELSAASKDRYQVINKKTRQVVDKVTGEILSRREYIKRTDPKGRTPESKALDNLLQLKRGADTAEGRNRLRKYLDKRARRKDAQQAFKEHQARKRGVRPRDIQVRGASPMAELFRSQYDVLSGLRERARERSLGKGNARRYVKALVNLGLVSEDEYDDWVRHYMGE